MFRIFQNPMLCIGSFIEAAVYARADLEVKLLRATQKNEHIIATLLDRSYVDQRTLIVCNNADEVQSLVFRLKQSSITLTHCDETSTDDEIGLLYILFHIKILYDSNCCMLHRFGQRMECHNGSIQRTRLRRFHIVRFEH